jgi:hypothetical protein
MSFTSSGDAEAFRPVKAMEWRDGCPARPVPSLCSESLRSTRPGDTVGKNAVPSAKADSTLFFARSQHSRAGLISDVAARLGAVGRGRPTLHRNHARIRRSGAVCPTPIDESTVNCERPVVIAQSSSMPPHSDELHRALSETLQAKLRGPATQERLPNSRLRTPDP